MSRILLSLVIIMLLSVLCVCQSSTTPMNNNPTTPPTTSTTTTNPTTTTPATSSNPTTPPGTTTTSSSSSSSKTTVTPSMVQHITTVSGLIQNAVGLAALASAYTSVGTTMQQQAIAIGQLALNAESIKTKNPTVYNQMQTVISAAKAEMDAVLQNQMDNSTLDIGTAAKIAASVVPQVTLQGTPNPIAIQAIQNATLIDNQFKANLGAVLDPSFTYSDQVAIDNSSWNYIALITTLSCLTGMSLGLTIHLGGKALQKQKQ